MRKGLVQLLAVVALFGGWLLFVHWEFAKLRHRGGTVAEHLATMPEPLRYRVNSPPNAEAHLVLEGPIRSVWTFPSGPPLYVVGPDGRLVDWTPDAGDDEKFNARWPGAYGGQQITREEAAKWPARGD